jgi:predicted acetyltransferase
MSASQNAAYLTAATALGEKAIKEVMEHAYQAETCTDTWSIARVVDGVPVSFIIVDPHRQMDFPEGALQYAFIRDVATRKDRRREGHFRGLMTHVFARLKAAGIPVVVTHGRYALYRRFGFEVFTHHSGIFITPSAIERALGHPQRQKHEEITKNLTITESPHILEDLLLISNVEANTYKEAKAALLTAATLARARDKENILFEHPHAPSYGSHYPPHTTCETPFTIVARACGARICVQGADPEGDVIPDADWIKVLDTPRFLREALKCRRSQTASAEGKIVLDTEVGTVMLASKNGTLRASDKIDPGARIVKLPSSALAQLVTGYQKAEVLQILHNLSLPDNALRLLNAWFPRQWRFSRNESWTYKA